MLFVLLLCRKGISYVDMTSSENINRSPNVYAVKIVNQFAVMHTEALTWSLHVDAYFQLLEVLLGKIKTHSSCTRLITPLMNSYLQHKC